MRATISLMSAVTVLCLLAGAAHAGGVKLSVNEDFISVTPPKRGATVTVRGLPRTAVGVRPIKVTVHNKATDVIRGGIVHKNGSFEIDIKAVAGSKLYVTFVAANGKKDTVKLKVPPRP